jgi:GT2 family glycosyltransferase
MNQTRREEQTASHRATSSAQANSSEHMEGIDVSIIYVNWNCAEEIASSIASVHEQTRTCRYEIIVVDNASPQPPGPLERDRRVQLIKAPENKGFGAGCNLGARFACGKYILLLNPDTRFRNDVLDALLGFLGSHPAAGVAGPLVEDSSGTVLFDGGRSLPTLLNEFLQHSTLAFRFPNRAWIARPYLSDWDHLSTREVGSVLGACMLLYADVFRSVGGFDEAFFLYCEEVDLCHRLRKAGFEVWYVHTARLLHKERQSTIQLFGSVSRIVLQNLKSQHYYFLKHYGVGVAFVWRHMIAALYLLRYVLKRDKSHLEYFKWAMTARMSHVHTRHSYS